MSKERKISFGILENNRVLFHKFLIGLQIINEIILQCFFSTVNNYKMTFALLNISCEMNNIK